MQVDKKNERFESYPRPSTADKQYNEQPEYIDQQPNDFEDKSVSNVPDSNADKQANDPERETGE
jgi:hypothetical protein